MSDFKIPAVREHPAPKSAPPGPATWLWPSRGPPAAADRCPRAGDSFRFPHPNGPTVPVWLGADALLKVSQEEGLAPGAAEAKEVGPRGEVAVVVAAVNASTELHPEERPEVFCLLSAWVFFRGKQGIRRVRVRDRCQ